MCLQQQAVPPCGTVLQFSKGGLAQVYHILHGAGVQIPHIENGRMLIRAKACGHEELAIADEESLADGHKVTMPLYWEIEALDHDLYLCATKNGDKVIVNGKGEIVR